MEAYSVVVDLLGQAHAYGESISAKMELWISISSGLIIMAYFAPDRLNKLIAGIVLLAYATFTAFVMTNSAEDARLGDLVLADALRIVEAHNLHSDALAHRFNDATRGRGSLFSGATFLGVLFLGTFGYVLYTAYQTHLQRRRDD